METVFKLPGRQQLQDTSSCLFVILPTRSCNTELGLQQQQQPFLAAHQPVKHAEPPDMMQRSPAETLQIPSIQQRLSFVKEEPANSRPGLPCKQEDPVGSRWPKDVDLPDKKKKKTLRD